jgi:hypothetical protein
VVIRLDSIIKYTHFFDSTAHTISKFTLKPSTGYFIEVNTHEYVPPSNAEKIELVRRIESNPDVRKLINEFAKKNIENSSIEIDDVEQFSNRLNNIVAVIVKRTNPIYNFRPPRLDRILARLFVEIANTKDRVNNVSEKIEADDSTKGLVPAYTEVLDTLLKQMAETDWYGIVKDDTRGYRNLKGTVESRKRRFAASPEKEVINDEFDNLMKEVDLAITQKQNILDTLIKQVLVNNVDKGSAISTTFPKEFQKQAQEFIRSDLGLAYVFGLDRVNPYVAAQISLSPLDDSIPLRQYRGIGNILRSRLSFMIGISVDGISKDSVRKGLIGDQALILGSGLKLWQWLKVNSGFYLYYSQPRNPLRDPAGRSFKGSPFISLSIDIRVQALLNGIGNSIFKNQTP